MLLFFLGRYIRGLIAALQVIDTDTPLPQCASWHRNPGGGGGVVSGGCGTSDLTILTK